MSTNLRAARAIALAATSPTEAREFLHMLGLLDDNGRIAPDESRRPIRPDTHKPVIRGSHFADKPKQSTAPEALRVLAPIVPVKAEKVVKAPAVREPRQRKKAAPVARKTGDCGTVAGHATHSRRGTTPCDPCRDAKNAQQREYWTRVHGKGPDPRRPPCGTNGGYQAHMRRSEKACGPCLEAAAEWQREKYRRVVAKSGRTVRPKVPAVCGTYAGYTAHRRKKEEKCEPCREAARLYFKKYDSRRKKAA